MAAEARRSARERAVGTPLHDLLGVWMIVWSYAPAVAALWLFGRHPSVVTFLFALAMVTVRMNALFVVVHESWHYNLFRSRRVNEIIGAVFASWPCVMPYDHSRTSHWNHHRYVGTARDPDAYAWKWDDDERGAFLWQLFLTATGLAYVVRLARLALGIAPPPGRPGLAPRPAVSRATAIREIPRLAAVHLVILAIFWKTIGVYWYFPLWFFPALSLFPALTGLREFLEHRRGALIVYRAWPHERFVFGCFNFHLHAFHHAYAAAPWFTLPSVGERALRKAPNIVSLGSYLGELFAYFAGRSRVPARALSVDAEPRAAGDLPLAQRSPLEADPAPGAPANG